MAGGDLVVLPTDTVYGIGTRPDDPAATARLFQAKRLPRDLELPVLVPTAAAAEGVCMVDERARALMDALWPGPLTLVLPRAEDSRAWDLGGDPETVGVRRPRHLMALALLELAGPLAVTSANVSGRRTPATCDELFEVFGREVQVYLCQEEPLAGQPSTVVDLAGSEPRLLREGPVSEAQIRAVIGG